MAILVGRVAPIEQGPIEAARGRVVASIERYLLPRLGERTVPLVVAVIGSTGAGKSTLINSLAGRPVTKTGVLRPTTKRATVWTSAAHREAMEAVGDIVEDNHPLLDSLALVDTPDLDSDVGGHYQEAMAVVTGADAVVFVTSAARYGDAMPWQVMISLARRMPVAVVLNRVPSRAAAARNDLLARLRRLGLGGTAVLSIGEQRVDPEKGLSRQSVHRVASLLRDWAAAAANHRHHTFDQVCDRVSADLVQLVDVVEERHRMESSLLQAMRARYEIARRQVEDRVFAAPTRRSRLRRRRERGRFELVREAVISAIDQAAQEVGSLWAESGIAVPPEYLRSSSETITALDQIASTADRLELGVVVTADGHRFASLLAGDAPESIASLRAGIEGFSHLTWPDE